MNSPLTISRASDRVGNHLGEITSRKLRIALSVVTVLAVLGGIEMLAHWWMRPQLADADEPVLVWKGGESLASIQDTGIHADQPHAGLSNSTYTPLPSLAAKSVADLRCHTGSVARIDRADGVTMHVAFFEWDSAASSSVMEAFKHFPEECMGSVGLKMIQHCGSRTYRVEHETILVDHTILREPKGPLVHAFKGIWVSGANRLLGDATRSLGEQSRRLRWEAAVKRFHPAHARVAQGAVRGISDPDLAWAAFQDAMLKDLTFAPPLH